MNAIYWAEVTSDAWADFLTQPGRRCYGREPAPDQMEHVDSATGEPLALVIYAQPKRYYIRGEARFHG